MSYYTHGLSYSSEYRVWASMKSRCRNPNDPSFYKYGGRGINYCASWEWFENFYHDMGPCEKGLSLDRIDNDKGYFPENCRWTTAKQQVENRRAYNILKSKGVYSRPSGRFISRIVVDGKVIHLGTFDSVEEATAARKNAEVMYR